MNGGFLHERLLLDGIDAEMRALGLATSRGVRVPSGYIDLVGRLGREVVACEAELTPTRVPNDLIKATELGATHLFIVTPDARVARRACRRLPTRDLSGPRVVVRPYGPAITSLRELFCHDCHID